MVPPSSAFAPARWQTSRPTSAVIGVIGSRPISRSVACTCCSGTTFRNGDWRSCSAERFAERVVEHRVAGAIDDRRQHDAVFLRQRRRRRPIDRRRSRRSSAAVRSGAPT